MNSRNSSITVLVAEDDADDRMLLQEVVDEMRLKNPLHFVKDGQELLNYLRCEGDYADRVYTGLPAILLLDLNLPKIDGREALRIIKNDNKFKQLPIVVLTTSDAEEDIVRSYDLGVNSFISKPVEFYDFVRMMATLTDYWLEFVSLPPTE